MNERQIALTLLLALPDEDALVGLNGTRRGHMRTLDPWPALASRYVKRAQGVYLANRKVTHEPLVSSARLLRLVTRRVG